MSPRVIDPNAPVILVEVETGVFSDECVRITKDDSITSVTIVWNSTDPMTPEYVAEVRRVLTPLRDEHPQFAEVLDRLDRIGA